MNLSAEPQPDNGESPFVQEQVVGPTCTRGCRWHVPMRIAGLTAILLMAGAYGVVSASPELVAMLPHAVLDWAGPAEAPHTCRGNFCTLHDHADGEAVPPPLPEVNVGTTDQAKSDAGAPSPE